MRNLKLIIAVVLPLCLLVACTNSRLVLRPLYNSLDNRIEESLLGYAELGGEQTNEIAALIDHFHVWHRQTQLPYYAALASTVADSLSLDEPVTAESVALWSQSLRLHADTVGRCNPIYLSSEILTGLSDPQVSEIQANRNEILQTRRRDDAVDFADIDASANAGGSAGEITGEEVAPGAGREQRQAKNAARLRRYIELAGLTVTDSQFASYKQTLARQQYPVTRFREILGEWDERFFVLLQRRQESGWPDLLREYIDARRTAFSQRRDSVRAHNTALWEDYAVRTINNLSPQQRRFVSNWLAKLSQTILSLAEDPPSYKAAKSRDYKCLGLEVVRP